MTDLNLKVGYRVKARCGVLGGGGKNGRQQYSVFCSVE